MDIHSALRQNERGIICEFRDYVDHFPLGLGLHTQRKVGMCVHRACLSKVASATGLYSETIALVCHTSGTAVLSEGRASRTRECGRIFCSGVTVLRS